MKSAIAVITYRRCLTLQTFLSGVEEHCPHYRLAIFEDCGQRDNTADWLQAGRVPTYRRELMAYEYSPPELPYTKPNCPNAQVFMGERNLGVAGNSNRALWWFLNETDCDHLCLCNDDLFVLGDFVKFYAQAHDDLGCQFFCFCDFTKDNYPNGQTYEWTTYKMRGYNLKFLPRLVGIMTSMTRPLIEKVGFFDTDFGKFGEEHCDYTYRCRFAGGIQISGQTMACVDVEHKFLQHQDCGTSMVGAERNLADREAAAAMAEASQNYRWRHYYRPFQLLSPKMAGGYSGGGISVKRLADCGYKMVTALV